MADLQSTPAPLTLALLTLTLLTLAPWTPAPLTLAPSSPISLQRAKMTRKGVRFSPQQATSLLVGWRNPQREVRDKHQVSHQVHCLDAAGSPVESHKYHLLVRKLSHTKPNIFIQIKSNQIIYWATSYNIHIDKNDYTSTYTYFVAGELQDSSGYFHTSSPGSEK